MSLKVSTTPGCKDVAKPGTAITSSLRTEEGKTALEAKITHSHYRHVKKIQAVRIQLQRRPICYSVYFHKNLMDQGT